MAISNTGKARHREHFYGKQADKANLTNVWIGDYFHELDGDRESYIWDGNNWILDIESILLNTIGDSGGGTSEVQIVGSTLVVGDDESVDFEDNAPVNTQEVIEIDKPSTIKTAYKFFIKNPSEVTDLTVKFFDVEADFGDSYITSIIVPKKATITGTDIEIYSVIIEGVFSGDLKIIISNNTGLGAADGFTVTIRVKEV